VEIMYPRVAGIDIGKREIAVAVRTPGDAPGERCQQIRKYKTFYQVLQQMVAGLVGQGVTHVAMEATGVYWKPVFHALCEADALEILLWPAPTPTPPTTWAAGTPAASPRSGSGPPSPALRSTTAMTFMIAVSCPAARAISCAVRTCSATLKTPPSATPISIGRPRPGTHCAA
jgi:hypothetical protein